MANGINYYSFTVAEQQNFHSGNLNNYVNDHHRLVHLSYIHKIVHYFELFTL